MERVFGCRRSRGNVWGWFRGRLRGPVSASEVGWGGLGAAGGSGERRDRADRVEHGGEVGLPWPAGGEVECPLAAGAGQSSGDLQEVTSAGVGGLDGCGGQADQCCPAREVVREGGDHCPGAVRGVAAGGEVRECLIFEVADGEFDGGGCGGEAGGWVNEAGAVALNARCPP